LKTASIALAGWNKPQSVEARAGARLQPSCERFKAGPAISLLCAGVAKLT
jgi:hypothetical protein